ncbi:MAG: BglG family transcription antiterminator [Anaerovibrio sp.]
MKKRSTEILQKLIRHEQKDYTLQHFAEKYAVSLRTIKNDIKEINEFIKKLNLPLLDIDEAGRILRGDSFDGSHLAACLYNMDIYNYRLSNEERLFYMVVSLLTSDTYTSMQRISDELCVSRATIINDFDELRSFLKAYDVFLLSDAGKGVAIKCQPGAKVRLLTEVFRRISINTKNEGFFQCFILKKLHIRYSFAQVFSYLQTYSRLNDLLLTEEAFYSIAVYTFTLMNMEEEYPWERTGSKPLPAASDTLLQLLQYTASQLGAHLTSRMQEDFLGFADEQDVSMHVRTIDEVELYRVVVDFLNSFQAELGMEFTRDTALLDSLLNHIKSMKDMTDDQFIELPEAHDALIDYKKIYQLVSAHAHILENLLHYKLSDNMKRSIVIHMGVAIIRHDEYADRLSVAIVCPGSMATGKYLEVQIRNYFDFHIAGVFSANEAERLLKDKQLEVAFIISTVKLNTDSYAVLKVNPFLDMKDLLMIQKYSLQHKHSQLHPTSYMRMRFLQQAAEARDHRVISPVIFNKIKEMVLQYAKELEQRQKNAIAQLLDQNYILFADEPLTWQQAIEKTAARLVADQYITEQYMQQCIENVRQYGSYIIISPRVALAHANKKFGVMKDGLSLLVAPQGVTFEDSNTVNLMFCFASTGENEYLELLQDLMRTGRTSSVVENICGYTSVRDVYDELVHM